MGRPVTLRTLAERLGVSKQTVSNAFSRPDQLSSELRTRILAEAERLGYSGPDPNAKALSCGRTGVVGVVLTERAAFALGDAAASEFLIGVTNALEPNGQNLLLISGRPEGTAPGSAVYDAAVDGLILYSLSPEDPYVTAAQARGLPLVTVDQPFLPGRPRVGADQRLMGRIAGEHLSTLGHRKVAVLSSRMRRDGFSGLVGPERAGSITFPLTAQRLDGIRDGVERVEAVWECPGIETIDEAIDHILMRTDCTAIAAMSDVRAIAAIRVLRERGVDVPAEMSVVGIDDIPEARAAGLTTVRQDHREKGAAAVAALACSESDGTGETTGGGPATAVEVSLVERTSTAPPRRI